jgi:hypothetical protein
VTTPTNSAKVAEPPGPPSRRVVPLTRSTSSDHGQVARTYTFRLTVAVDEDHEAYDDPEWIADAAWGALKNVYGLECTYEEPELVDDPSSKAT